MAILGLLVTLLGFLLSVFSLGMTGNLTMRMVLVIAGIMISLFGIIGLINSAYLKNAIWKR